jgi:DNA-binding transcriptional ArsR family regulator
VVKIFGRAFRFGYFATKRFRFMRRDVFQAIADPTRREIINMVAHRSLNVNAVAGNFDVSRTAIYKHVKILTECGLVVVRQQGRERFCEARLEKLHEVSDWVGQYREFWNARLDALENYLSEVQVKTGPKKPGKSK